MENNHKLALYVAYYLSKFNVAAYNSLGYNTMDEAHKGIGKILNTNPHTVKNMRNQSNPRHGNTELAGIRLHCHRLELVCWKHYRICQNWKSGLLSLIF